MLPFPQFTAGNFRPSERNNESRLKGPTIARDPGQTFRPNYSCPNEEERMKSRILIAEREPNCLFSLREKIPPLGYQIMGSVKSASAAIEQARDKRPNLVIINPERKEIL